MLKRPADLTAADFPISRRPNGEFAEVAPLVALCTSGKLYEVEQWIADNRPIQFPPSEDRKERRRSAALQISIKRGFHSLAALLLANGYAQTVITTRVCRPRWKPRIVTWSIYFFGSERTHITWIFAPC
jgi:hypothetical protein